MFGYVPTLGIDLGTSNVFISTRNRGVVLREPSIITIYRSSKTLHAVGRES